MLTIRETCRLCASRDLSVVLELPPTPIGDRYTETPEPDAERFPLTLVRCESCGLLQLREVIDAETLYSHYRYRTADSLGLSDYFERYVEDVAPIVRGRVNGGCPLAVDIGSNDETLLRALRARGYTVIGVDPAAGRDTKYSYRSYFTASEAHNLLAHRGQADIITANNVLANVDDVHDFMEGVKTLLAPDGIFVCETGSGPDLIASRLYDCIYHEHLSYFGLNQLVRLFNDHGLFIIKAVHTDSKGGCIRIYARRIRFWESRVIRELQDQQREPTHADLAWFRLGLEQLRSDLTRNPPYKWYFGYGASVGVTTLRYALGLESLMHQFVDDNTSRHGLFVPGDTARVLSSVAIYEFPARDTLVILFAWRYADVILAKHQAFLAGGGVILQPLPTLTIHTGESYGRRHQIRPDESPRGAPLA